jgi:hypothetical protein
LRENIHKLEVGEIVKLVGPTWIKGVDIRYFVVTSVDQFTAFATVIDLLNDGRVTTHDRGRNRIHIDLGPSETFTSIELLDDEEAMMIRLTYL